VLEYKNFNLSENKMSKINVNIITSQNTDCGIADTSEQLVKELNKCENIKINVIPITDTQSKNPFSFIQLLKGIKKNQITHIQYQPALYGLLPVPLIEVNYIPLVITLLKLRGNNIITTIHEAGLNSWINHNIIKFLNLSDKIIVHNSKMIEILNKEGIDKNKMVEIPLGTSEAHILNKEKSKEQLNVSDKKIITIFGFIGKNKGHDLAIEILPELGDNTILFVAGGARTKDQAVYKEELVNKVKSLGLENRVKFFDFVDTKDLPLIASATDIFIYPYRWIVASAALNLALSYRIPTITSDLSYFKGIKDKYDCIELFKNGNKQELLVKIKELMNNKERQSYLKKRCEEFYDKTSWKAVALETESIYTEFKH
jgi:glycosyltransferase involved in cell wall biosynthesis